MNGKRLALLGGHAARPVARMIDLTPARVDVVVALYAGPLCQRDLATRLCVHDSVVSRLVHALMKLGFVEREIPVADRRFRIVTLTLHGRERYGEIARSQFLMDPPGRFDCQSYGEGLWTSFWHDYLGRMGLEPLTRLALSDDPDEPRCIEPRYDAFRHHYRRGCMPFPVVSIDDDTDEAWQTTPKPPRLQQGLVPDPTSVRFAREFASRRMATDAARLAAWRAR